MENNSLQAKSKEILVTGNQTSFSLLVEKVIEITHLPRDLGQVLVSYLFVSPRANWKVTFFLRKGQSGLYDSRVWSSKSEVNSNLAMFDLQGSKMVISPLYEKHKILLSCHDTIRFITMALSPDVGFHDLADMDFCFHDFAYYPVGTNESNEWDGYNSGRYIGTLSLAIVSLGEDKRKLTSIVFESVDQSLRNL